MYVGMYIVHSGFDFDSLLCVLAVFQ